MTKRITSWMLAAALIAGPSAMVAQYHDNDHHDNGNHNGWNGNDRHDNDHHDNGNHNGWRDNDHHDNGNHNGWNNNDRHDYRFRSEDRNRWERYYRSDINRYRRNRNWHHRYDFRAGMRIPAGVTFRTVPPSYYRGMAPLPPGYRYGYYDGYVVAYDPTSRMIADVMDLVTSAAMQ
jgi:hypothetical protein